MTLARAASRVVELALTLLGSSVVVFAALHAAPGSPEDQLVPDRRNATAEAIAAIRAQYHLDEPLPMQYWLWLKGVLTGDLGRSMQYGDQVTDLLLSRLPTTLWLVGYATTLFVVVGVTLGRLAAVHRGRVDTAILVGTSLLTGIPSFVAAIALLAVFAVALGWFPVLGDGSDGGLLGRLHHLTLPAISMAIGSLAIITRVTRQAMLSEGTREHVQVATGRGVPRRLVVRRHILRGSLGPVTTMAGMLFAGLFAGTVVVEQAFGLSGIGALLVAGINAQDFPLVQAVLLLLVAVYVVVSALVDLVHSLIDPRLRAADGAAVRA